MIKFGENPLPPPLLFLITCLLRCILNKADQVDRQRLMRVYGALMWSLGKVIKSPEVLRVYIGSFWDQPLMYDENAQLFEMEEKDLMQDLKDLPRNSAVRKINELVKRVRLCKVHAYIISHLKEQMPMLMGHAKKQKELLENLPQVFRSVLKKYNLAPGDFPEITDFKGKLAEHDFTKFSTLKQRMIDDAEQVLGVEFPRLMEALPRATADVNNPVIVNSSATAAPASASAVDSNPFGAEEFEKGPADWALAEYIPQYQAQFNATQVNGFVTGAAAKPVMGGSGLPVATLRKIWGLSDIDQDGSLDLQEFVIALFLIDMAKKGHTIPDQLDEEMIPPEKKR